MDMKTLVQKVDWQSCAALLARLVFAGVFGMNALVTFLRVEDTAQLYAVVGLPFSLLMAWISGGAAVLLSLSFLTGIGMRWAALATLGFVFLIATMNGREGNPNWFGVNISRTTYTVTMLYMAAFGPGRFVLKLRRRSIS
jgi:uncharacterized membrane protein YphA (DoxX/SURF4 family)